MTPEETELLISLAAEIHQLREWKKESLGAFSEGPSKLHDALQLFPEKLGCNIYAASAALMRAYAQRLKEDGQ